MTLADRLKSRLEALNLSQSELARRVGVTQSSIAHLVTGRSAGSTHLHRIARELQTTVEYLTGETDDASANTPLSLTDDEAHLIVTARQRGLSSSDLLGNRPPSTAEEHHAEQQDLHDLSGKLATVGTRLRAERERLGLTQSKMAAIGGVNRNSQSDYEAGKRPCSVAYMLAVREAGVDVGFLFTGKRSSEQLEDDETELLSCFRQLDPAERAAVIQVARSMAGRKAPSSRIHAEPLALTPERVRTERR